jgi:hypothetical protein
MNWLHKRIRRGGSVTLAVAVAAGLLMLAAAAAAEDDDLNDLLSGVGEEYARAYLAPLTSAFGPNLNSALYSTAAIPHTRLTIGFGIKVMGAYMNEEDQTFRRVVSGVDLGDYDPDYAGRTGDVVMSGPSVIGSTETMGRIDGYENGILVFSQETIEGLVETRWVPLAAPEISVGGVAGLRATVRWVPSLSIGEAGDVELFGYGLQWSANTLLQTLPLDVMVGFFKQDVDIGTVITGEASSFFVAASKDFSMLTLYGGLGFESSDVTYAYTYTDETSGATEEISFDVESEQDSRVTFGATLDLPLKINLEAGLGDVTVYSAGLLFGF